MQSPSSLPPVVPVAVPELVVLSASVPLSVPVPPAPFVVAKSPVVLVSVLFEVADMPMLVPMLPVVAASLHAPAEHS